MEHEGQILSGYFSGDTIKKYLKAMSPKKIFTNIQRRKTKYEFGINIPIGKIKISELTKIILSNVGSSELSKDIDFETEEYLSYKTN